MPRPFPWIPRLSNIRRSVSNSQRSDYSRADLQVTFGISKSAAGRLMEMLATGSVGAGHLVHLVSRERLSSFLEAVSEADDVSALCDKLRAERENLTRVKARYLYLRDEAEVPIASLPASIRVEPGRLEIRFDSLEELVGQLVMLSLAMNDNPVAFQAACEPLKREELSAEARDARYIREETERLKLAQTPAKTPAPKGEGASRGGLTY